ncbi:Medium-chain fatty-acid--CoA ligase [Mycolicibacterium vanbaalenii]|uniref:Medium-chain fatty-acid--CoA ligase n=1 Tax=Mycolicibacterium vanbaalenii TaxID=110539 RepID=A0A5S9NFY4_MYCVN|nr:AMP-binding protein [Mycolicibacterium vanbaalenii]CAA0089381.1 Medium-chain fatty-acid--CoA ligase [Mycolicibacterium vanbaalenii]
MLVPTRPSDADHRRAGFWEDRTLSSFLAEAADLHPDAIAVSDGVRPFSYRELRDRAAGLASALPEYRVRAHDVVTVFLPNWPEAVEVIHGATWAGCVINPVVTTYRHAELSFILQQSGTRAIFIPHVFRGFDYVAMLDEMVTGMVDPPTVIVVRPQGELPPGFVSFDELLGRQPIAAPIGSPSDICLLLYTSGTTSEPKGVLHSHQTVIWEMRSIIRELGLRHEGDRTFMASPVGHLTGIVYGVYLPTLLQQSVSLLDVWEPDAAVDIIERDACRISLGATPFLRGLTVAYTRRGMPSSLRIFLCGGADVPPDLVVEASGVLDAVVTRTYGSSELPTYSVSGAAAPIDRRACTDGLPIYPAEGYLINERDGVGELAVRGPELFLGYLNSALNEAAFTVDGYFRTGDLVEIDDAGALTVRGRVKDIIVRGGENISALEVETHLREHDAIEDVAVVGYPDDTMGERVGAFLVLRPGTAPAGAPSTENIGAFLRVRGLAAHKRPETIEIVAELPRTASGKVQKQLLRQRLSSQ